MTAARTAPLALSGPPRRLGADSFSGAHRVVFLQEKILSAPDDLVLPALDGVGGLTALAPEHLGTDVTLFDTAEHALAERGVCVRREAPGPSWVIVSPALSWTGEPVRRELYCAAGPDPVPDTVLALLGRHLPAERLRPVAHMTGRRSTVPLLNRGGMRLADVVDERVRAVGDDGREQCYREVLIHVRDLDGIGHALLADIAAVLEAAGCRAEAPASELVRAFGAVPRSAVGRPIRPATPAR